MKEGETEGNSTLIKKKDQDKALNCTGSYKTATDSYNFSLEIKDGWLVCVIVIGTLALAALYIIKGGKG